MFANPLEEICRLDRPRGTVPTTERERNANKAGQSVTYLNSC